MNDYIKLENDWDFRAAPECSQSVVYVTITLKIKD